MAKTIGVSVIVAIAVSLGVAFFVLSTYSPVTPPPPYGGNSGTLHTNLETFQAGIVTGGGVGTVTTSGVAVAASNVCNNETINVTLQAAGTLNLTTSTTLFSNCLSFQGASKIVIFHNNTGTTGVGSAFTLAAGDTSSTMQLTLNSSTATFGSGTSSVNGGDNAIVKFIRNVSGTQAWLYEDVTVFR